MVNHILNQVKRLKPHKIQSNNSHLSSMTERVTPTGYFRRKYILDFSLALFLLLPGLPLMAILMVLVRLTSRGPAIYRQCRAGQNGKIFYMYKIRTMIHDAESRIGPAWAQAVDPRVTPVGHFLRKFHLDELPQLINVLKGEMSLVGPRPERPEFVKVLSRHIPDYVNRLKVRPGITGLAQLNLPPDSNLDSVRRKLLLDVEYIQTATFWLDLRLICCTGLRLGKLPVIRLFGLKRSVILQTSSIEKKQPVVTDSVMTLKHIQQVKTPSSDENLTQHHRSHNVKSSSASTEVSLFQ